MRPVSKKRTHNKRKLTEVIENNYAIKKVKTNASSSAAGMSIRVRHGGKAT